MAKYQTASRGARLWRRRSVSPENIAHPASRFDQRLLAGHVDLLTKAMNQDIDDVGARVEVVVPNLREDHRLGDHPPGVPRQVLEQREFARAQIDAALAASDLAGQQVNRQIADNQ